MYTESSNVAQKRISDTDQHCLAEDMIAANRGNHEAFMRVSSSLFRTAGGLLIATCVQCNTEFAPSIAETGQITVEEFDQQLEVDCKNMYPEEFDLQVGYYGQLRL